MNKTPQEISRVMRRMLLAYEKACLDVVIQAYKGSLTGFILPDLLPGSTDVGMLRLIIAQTEYEGWIPTSDDLGERLHLDLTARLNGTTPEDAEPHLLSARKGSNQTVFYVPTPTPKDPSCPS